MAGNEAFDTDEFEIEIEGNELEKESEEASKKAGKIDTKKKSVDDVDIEIVDDTPPEDRGRQPMPKEIVEELEADELEEYSDKVKQRLKQMKKVWHDERREKERVMREQNEALSVAQRLKEENEKLRKQYSQGEKSYVDTYKQAAEYQLEKAKSEYKQAYDRGDTDAILAAQEVINDAQMKLNRVKEYKPSLQDAENGVEVNTGTEKTAPKPQVPEPDERTKAWQKENTWFGSDMEMTSLAMGYHQQLVQEKGPQYASTDEYWDKINKRMRQRFPEYFDEGDDSTDATESTASRGGKPAGKADNKPAVNVAPASRSTAPRKIRLSKTQVALAKRLGITNEQYAAEFAKLQKEER